MTPLPTVKLYLGQYVVTKARVGGTARVYFQVPPRLRPPGWSAAIPLPRSGPRTGDLTNAYEVAAIKADAEALCRALSDARLGKVAKKSERSLTALSGAWQASSAWPDNPKTRIGYLHYAKRVTSWGDAAGELDPGKITRDQVEKFLALFNANPSTKKHVLQVLRMIMDQAIAKGWRTDNPCDGIRVKVAISRAQVWEQADVDAYVEQARAMGRDSIALIILLEWEIGQRLTDVRGFRPGAEYDAAAGVFRFYQSKTESYVTIPVSETLRELLAPAIKGELFMFRDEVTKKAYAEARLSKVFKSVRDAVAAKAREADPQAKPRHLLLKWLRHSCVVQLARVGCTPLEIAAITGHAIASVVQILSVYLPRDNEVAWNAQVKRGLVAARS
jgi:hypothetical protein